MSVFIEAATEAFGAVTSSLAQLERENGSRSGPGGAAGVRRPVRGYQVKENSYATLRIIGPNSQFYEVIDAAGEVFVEGEGVRKTHYYSNFFVHSVKEQRQEKTQIVNNFGDPIIFLFGQAPRMVEVSGTLLNTADFNWRNEFWHNYENYFRGTRLAELNARLYLIYDDRIIEGLMLNASAQETSQSRASIQFSFQMFVTGTAPITRVGDPDFPKPNNTTIDFSAQDSYERGLRAWEDARRIANYTLGEKLLEANQIAFTAQTLTGVISDLLSGNFLNAGVPGVAAFAGRAAGAAAGVASVVGDLFGIGGSGPTQPDRIIPIRESIIDNVDEFIGGTPQTVDEKLADRISQIGEWTEADLSIDNLILGTINVVSSFIPTPGSAPEPPFSTVDPPFYDMMGRSGRADLEISAYGGSRSGAGDDLLALNRIAFEADSGGGTSPTTEDKVSAALLAANQEAFDAQTSGSTNPTVRGEALREVPFGLIAAPGEMPQNVGDALLEANQAAYEEETGG